MNEDALDTIPGAPGATDPLATPDEAVPPEGTPAPDSESTTETDDLAEVPEELRPILARERERQRKEIQRVLTDKATKLADAKRSLEAQLQKLQDWEAAISDPERRRQLVGALQGMDGANGARKPPEHRYSGVEIDAEFDKAYGPMVRRLGLDAAIEHMSPVAEGLAKEVGAVKSALDSLRAEVAAAKLERLSANPDYPDASALKAKIADAQKRYDGMTYDEAYRLAGGRSKEAAAAEAARVKLRNDRKAASGLPESVAVAPRSDTVAARGAGMDMAGLMRMLENRRAGG
jgi:hypothetical protein